MREKQHTANKQMKEEELGQNLDGDLKFGAWVEGSALTPREQEKQERKGLSSYKMDGHRAQYLCLLWCRMQGKTELEKGKH